MSNNRVVMATKMFFTIHNDEDYVNLELTWDLSIVSIVKLMLVKCIFLDLNRQKPIF